MKSYVAALLLSIGTSLAQASLIGDSVIVESRFSNLATVIASDTVTVTAAVEISCPGAFNQCSSYMLPGESIDIGALSISGVFVSFFNGVASFNGFVFDDLDFAGGGSLSGFTLATTMPGLTASDITFDADTLFVNLAGTNPGTFTIDLVVTAVPEPTSLALLGAALVAFGLGRRRKAN